MNIIKNIENTCKMKKLEMNKVLPKEYQIHYDKKGNKKYIIIADNKHKILTGTYRHFGVYQQSTHLWIWASSLGNVDIKTIYRIKKLKMFNYLFKNQNNEKSQFYYQLLTQDVVQIDDIKKLDWINCILLYLTNGLYYFNPINHANIQFVILKRIHEKFV
jgi:hypothetical protein